MSSNASSNQNASNNQAEPGTTGKKLNFRCSDVGPKNCDWQVSGNSEQEIMPKIEQHGREDHGMTIDDQTRDKVRGAIHRQAA
jgi:predicted small metal-binding protein